MDDAVCDKTKSPCDKNLGSKSLYKKRPHVERINDMSSFSNHNLKTTVITSYLYQYNMHKRHCILCVTVSKDINVVGKKRLFFLYMLSEVYGNCGL